MRLRSNATKPPEVIATLENEVDHAPKTYGKDKSLYTIVCSFSRNRELSHRPRVSSSVSCLTEQRRPPDAFL
jgi:hypothetical protein